MPRHSHRSGNGRFAPSTNGHSLYGGPYGNGMDLIALNMLQQSVANASVSLRSTLTRRIGTDDRRDINDEVGYPETAELTPEDYRRMYDRNPIAARVCHVLPEESWAAQPSVFEDEDSDTVTEFEEAWDNLGRSLQEGGDVLEEKDEESWYQDEEGNPIWEYLTRADALSGIGSFGAILLGFDDINGNGDLSQAVKPGDGRKLLYLRIFDESMIHVSQWNSDRKSRRYGMPEVYTVTFSDPQLGLQTGMGLDISFSYVHWTRIIHIADNMMSSEVLGVPRMQPVYDNLTDLKKLYAGSAEMYWRGAFPGYSFETHPQLGGEVSIDESRMKDQIEQWQNGLQRMMSLTGMQMVDHAPQVVDPTPQIQTQIEAICIKLGIPMRIFMGSERGELASSQDARAWNDRMRARQRNYITPRIIVPFVNRLIRVGVLPKPIGYSVHWPDPETLSPLEKADIAVKRTQAIVAYTQGGGDTIMPPMDYLSRELHYDEEEAKTILENALDHVDPENDQATSPLLGLVGGITGMTELFKLAADGGITQQQLKQLIMLFFKVNEERADEIIADGMEKEAEREQQAQDQADMQAEALKQQAKGIPNAQGNRGATSGAAQKGPKAPPIPPNSSAKPRPFPR